MHCKVCKRLLRWPTLQPHFVNHFHPHIAIFVYLRHVASYMYHVVKPLWLVGWLGVGQPAMCTREPLALEAGALLATIFSHLIFSHPNFHTSHRTTVVAVASVKSQV